MLDALKKLLESDIINEDTRDSIQEAWEGQLTEAKAVIRSELREEFAQRYEHDKSVMVEALDKMVSEGLTAEIKEFAQERAALAEDRVKFNAKMNESATKFNDFMVTKLAEEISELRKDRTVQKENFSKLESFIMEALAKEIKEFAQDKKDVVESKVKLVAEAKNKLDALQKRFVAENSAKVKSMISKQLQSEMSQLHEDIKVARENNFGRRIFEAFATEFGKSYLSENAEIRKLHNVIEAKDKKLKEAAEFAIKAKTLVESKDREVRIIKESNERAKIMDELLSPLNGEKAEVMSSLLENVQTGRLKSAYEKYLPAVLKEGKKAVKTEKAVITESSKEMSGNKTVTSKGKDSDSNIIDLKKLAGL